MQYVDGYVMPTPKNLAACRCTGWAASKGWREHGALEYRDAFTAGFGEVVNA